jgi:peptidoglycan/LPS O-acetylase OafA/YrhL
MGHAQSEFRRDINGLRAIAVAAVVLFHFSIPGFQGGFIGVDIFFVVSGYLITGMIYPRLRKGTFSIVGFYINRGQRIIPALAFLCLSLLTLGWFFLLPFEYKLLGKHAAGSIGFVSNMLNWTEGGYFDSAARDKWLLHTWSLSVEWQFYLLFPLILILLVGPARAHARWVVVFLAIVSLGISAYLANHAPTEAFYFLHSRAWEMLAGAIVYLFPIRVSSRASAVLEWAGLSLILAGAVACDVNMAWPGFAALVPVIGAVLIIVAGQPAIDHNRESIITGNPLFQFLGTISYSIYLWHWPVVVALNFFGRINQPVWIGSGISLSVLLGYLSFHFIETPARKRGVDSPIFRSRKHLPAIAGQLAMIVVVGAFGAEVFATNGVPFRMTDSVRIASMEVENINPLTKKCFRESGPTSPSCIVGKHSDNVSVIVIGDSHANALISAVTDALPNTAKGGALFLGYGLCPTITGVRIIGKNADHQCAKFMGDTFAKLAIERSGLPVVVINRTSFYVWGGVPESNSTVSASVRIIDFSQASHIVDDQYLNEFRARYVESMCLLSRNHPVYVTKPIPEFSFDVPRTLAKRLQADNNAQDIAISVAEYESRNRFATSLMREAQDKCGVHLLDPVPYLCPDGKCMGSLHNRPLYFDSNHLSEYGNKFLVPMFKEVFTREPTNQGG